MANSSILAAFERMWQHIITKLGNKVDKSGDKMDGRLLMGNNSGIKSSDETLQYWFRDENEDFRGALKLDSSNRFYLNQRETGATYAENYRLPSVATGLTDNVWYNVLTDKNPVTVAQGGTGATTAEDACSKLGAIKKTGDTVTGKLFIGNNSGIKSSDSTQAFMFRDSGEQIRCALKVSSNNRFFVSQRETGASYSDQYVLPEVTTGLTTDKTYQILTSKNRNELFSTGNTVLSSYQYGTTLPTAGTKGRIFFKKA